MQDDGRLRRVRSEQSEARANETGFFKGFRWYQPEKAEIQQNAGNWRW